MRHGHPGLDSLSGPGCKKQVHRSSKGKMNSHHRFIAPSLASAAVLLTAIGLSRELLMHESPTAHFIPTRQRAAGELLKSPETSSPMGRLHDEFGDGVVESKSKLAANKPRTVTNGRLDESFDYRSTDEPLLGADKERQDNKELDRLRPDGSRGSNAEIKAAAKIAAAPSVLHAQRKLNNERLAESSVTARLAQKGIAEEAPVDEIRRNQARSKADLNDSDIEFSLLSNGLARREGYEAAQAMEMESGKNEILKIRLPAVLQIQAGINHPRYASLRGIMQAKRKELLDLSLEDLNLAPEDVGSMGARIEIRSIFVPDRGKAAEIMEGDPASVAANLVDKLRREAKVI